MSVNTHLPINHDLVRRLTYRMAQDVEPSRVTWYLETAATTANQIMYINRRSGYELVPPLDSNGTMEVTMIGRNIAAGTAHADTPRTIATLTFNRTAAGVTTIGATGTITPFSIVVINDEIIRVRVTPAVATQCIWEVSAIMYCVSSPIRDSVPPPGTPNPLLQ
jgi:hypothetical protein